MKRILILIVLFLIKTASALAEECYAFVGADRCHNEALANHFCIAHQSWAGSSVWSIIIGWGAILF